MAVLKDGSIVVNEWSKGVGASSHTGFQAMHLVDPYERPGVLTATRKTDSLYNGQPDHLINVFAVNGTTGQYWALMTNGRLLRATTETQWDEILTGSTQTNASGNGLVYYKGFLVIARDSFIDYYNLASPAFNNGVHALSSGDQNHYMMVWNDAVLIANGRYVAMIEEVVGSTFDGGAGGAATRTYTDKALDLPADCRITSFAPLGDRILIGTIKTAGATGTVPLYNSAQIFVWDGFSKQWDSIIELNTNGINAMVAYKGRVYVQAGWHGTWYMTDGYNVVKIAEIPNDLLNQTGQYRMFTRQTAVTVLNDRIVFGMSDLINTTPYGYQGIWTLNPDTGALNFEARASNGQEGINGTVLIGAVYPRTQETFYFSWSYPTTNTFGLDKTADATYNNTKSAYVYTPLYRVGTVRNPKTYNSLEVSFSRKLGIGTQDGVRVSYRTDLTADWTILKEWIANDDGAVTGFETGIDCQTIQNIQLRIELTSGDTELLEVRLT